MNNKLLNFLYLLCLYLACQLLPYEKMVTASYQQMLIKSLFLCVCLGFCIYEYIKDKNKVIKHSNIKNLLISLPLLIGGLSNILYGLFFKENIVINFQISTFITELLVLIISVIIEEFLFRIILIDYLQNIIKAKYKNILVILISSFAFSLMHAINFFGNSPINVLIQMGYTFILGIVLSILTISIDGLILPIIGHFIFNFFNTALFNILFDFEINWKYILFSCGIGVFCLAYSLVIYYLKTRRGNTDAS